MSRCRSSFSVSLKIALSVRSSKVSIVSSALGAGLGPGVAGRERSAAAFVKAAGVILIRFPSDCCCSGLGEGAGELAALPTLDRVREASRDEAGCEGVGGWLKAESAAPSTGDGGDGFPSFARRLLRIWDGQNVLEQDFQIKYSRE